MSETIDYLSDRLKIDKHLSITFTLIFSRFEYSLKNMGCFIGSDKNVYADWYQYSRKENIREAFQNIASQEVINAVSYLLENPPKKQVVSNNNVIWKTNPPDPNLPKSEQAILMVRRIRNNLMHGGKFHGTLQPEVARDTRLIESSIIVLEHCLKLDYELKEYFYQ